jgi:hypothetical protein
VPLRGGVEPVLEEMESRFELHERGAVNACL